MKLGTHILLLHAVRLAGAVACCQ